MSQYSMLKVNKTIKCSVMTHSLEVNVSWKELTFFFFDVKHCLSLLLQKLAKYKCIFSSRLK